MLPPCPLLRERFETKRIRLADGSAGKLQANISPDHSFALYRAVLGANAKHVLEVGMGQAISTLSILTALAETGGTMISVDPFDNWKVSGRDSSLAAVREAGFADRHRLLELPSYRGLPQLLEAREKFDFIYIDGGHDFQDCYLDFVYADRMLDVGGTIGFNDTRLRGVAATLVLLRLTDAIAASMLDSRARTKVKIQP